MPRTVPVVVVLGLALLSPYRRVARADEVEALRIGLVDGDKSTWPAKMDAIGKSAAQVGAVVGPMLRDRDLRHVTATAFAAAWLADHPAGGRVLLDEEIVRRGGDDPPFVGELRSALSIDGGGWARLVGVARGLAIGPTTDPALAWAGVKFLRHEATASNVRDLLEFWESAEAESLRSAAKESLEVVLGAPFDDSATLRRFLDRDRGRTLTDWIRDLSIAKDRPDAPRFRRLLVEASGNLDRVTTPDGLRPYLLPASTPWPEIRRLAAARAKSIDPSAAGWTALYAEAVDGETDADTLDTLLGSFESIRTIDPAAAGDLAQNAARRLEARPAPADGLSTGLLAVLGRLGTAEQLRRVFGTLMEGRASTPVLLAWIDAAAAVHGLSAEIRELHRSRRASAAADAVSLRIRALGALAKGGTDGDGEAAASGAYLAEILARRPDAPDAPQAASSEERSAAARGLEAFLAPSSIEALVSRAVDSAEDAVIARLSASVLARLAAKEARIAGAHATVALDALIGVARSSGVPAARISAVDDLARLAADGIDEPSAATEVFRLALDPSGPIELRRAAARAAAAAVDPRALSGVLALVAEEAASPDSGPAADSVLRAADRLVRALASRDASSDANLALECRSLLDGSAAGSDAAITLAAAAADASGGRPALQELRAGLLLRRTHAVGRTIGERIADLDQAHRILAATLHGAAAADPRLAAGTRVVALRREILVEGLRLRTAELQAEAKVALTADGLRLLELHRGLDAALDVAAAAGITSTVIPFAVEANMAVLRTLRESTTRVVRLAALVASTRVELKLPRSRGWADRARAFVASAKGLDPTKPESAEIATVEAEVDSAAGSEDGAPTPPK